MTGACSPWSNPDAREHGPSIDKCAASGGARRSLFASSFGFGYPIEPAVRIAPARGVLDKNAFMRACREGGAAIEQALRQLDRAYFQFLLRDAMRGLRDRDAARDLVQDTFIKVWRRCATFQGDSELLPWIRSILRHALLDQLRKTSREVAIEDEQDLTEQARMSVQELSIDHIAAPDLDARRNQLEECFRRCWERFERASPAHALVLSWIVEEGMSHEQIAALLGRTPGATREFISQCRKRARVHLAEWYELAVDSQ